MSGTGEGGRGFSGLRSHLSLFPASSQRLTSGPGRSRSNHQVTTSIADINDLVEIADERLLQHPIAIFLPPNAGSFLCPTTALFSLLLSSPLLSFPLLPRIGLPIVIHLYSLILAPLSSSGVSPLSSLSSLSSLFTTYSPPLSSPFASSPTLPIIIITLPPPCSLPFPLLLPPPLMLLQLLLPRETRYQCQQPYHRRLDPKVLHVERWRVPLQLLAPRPVLRVRLGRAHVGEGGAEDFPL